MICVLGYIFLHYHSCKRRGFKICSSCLLPTTLTKRITVNFHSRLAEGEINIQICFQLLLPKVENHLLEFWLVQYFKWNTFHLGNICVLKLLKQFPF